MDNIRILCIDDEEEIRLALKAVFESQGWRGDFACDVEQGMACVDRAEPDIIIMDYHMPRIDGVTGTGMFRKRLPNTPIIIFTIEDDQAVADRFLAAGASDFAIKPLRAPDIIARIRLHIRMLEASPAEDKSLGDAFVEKGISRGTLSLITGFMAGRGELTVEGIAEGTGLAYQTVYRYIQYMQDKGTVTAAQSYGKVGRPKRRFCLTEDMK